MAAPGMRSARAHNGWPRRDRGAAVPLDEEVQAEQDEQEEEYRGSGRAPAPSAARSGSVLLLPKGERPAKAFRHRRRYLSPQPSAKSIRLASRVPALDKSAPRLRRGRVIAAPAGL